MSWYTKMAGKSEDVARGVAQTLHAQKGSDPFQSAAIDSIIAAVGSFCGGYPGGFVAVETGGHVGGKDFGNATLALTFFPAPPAPAPEPPAGGGSLAGGGG